MTNLTGVIRFGRRLVLIDSCLTSDAARGFGTTLGDRVDCSVHGHDHGNSIMLYVAGMIVAMSFIVYKEILNKYCEISVTTSISGSTELYRTLQNVHSQGANTVCGGGVVEDLGKDHGRGHG
ncbi:hypothetical protein OG21DRAFT_860302 [Imleria badia]|jgi:hypothetical protein|nr:hypothetical protein OG21DRAFT_860302 [Imleria badia]